MNPLIDPHPRRMSLYPAAFLDVLHDLPVTLDFLCRGFCLSLDGWKNPKNSGCVPPKMDGENNGSKPYFSMDDLGENPYFWFNTQMFVGAIFGPHMFFFSTLLKLNMAPEKM